MQEALALWITPAIVVLGFIFTWGTIRNLRVDLRQDMKQMESRFEARMDRMEARIREDMERLDGRVARLEHGQAKLEGLLEGLSAAITRQDAA